MVKANEPVFRVISSGTLTAVVYLTASFFERLTSENILFVFTLKLIWYIASVMF